MWSAPLDDPQTKAAYERIRHRGLDPRLAFMVAAVDGAYRNRVATGFTPLEAYARSLEEFARINALVEGYSDAVASERAKTVYEKTKREGVDHPERPHEERLFPVP